MIALTEISTNATHQIIDDLGASAISQVHENLENRLYNELTFSEDVAVYFSNNMDYIILHNGKDITTVDLKEFETLIIA